MKGVTTMKVVINICYGGFGLSEEAIERYKELSGKSRVYEYEMERNDPCLVQVVEELGAAADGFSAKLKVV